MKADPAKIDEAVLALLYLNAFKDEAGWRAWKTLNWESLDRLHAQGLITDPKSRAKSVMLTEAGLRAVRACFEAQFAAAPTAQPAMDTLMAPGSWVYQCTVTLQEIQPPIWRRVLVEPSITVAAFHETLYRVVGWTGCHLHEFEVGSLRLTSPTDDEAVEDLPDDALDDRRYRLEHVLTDQRTNRLRYAYDFGDGWEHEILIEARLPKTADGVYPVCLAGERACPPEDCGGPWGYEELLKILRDPTHQEHEERLVWLGSAFDAERFDLNEVNEVLQEVRSTSARRRRRVRIHQLNKSSRRRTS